MLKIVTNNLKTELLDGFIRSSKLPGEEEATRTDREESEKKLPLTTSVYIVALISFVGDMARGALFPVLWKLCEKLGGTAIDLGYLIACFSAGRMAFGPPLGYLSDAKTHRLSLMIATVVLSAGAFFWANTSVMGNIYFLYLAQFLLGCGSGSLGVTRAFVAEQCPAKRKTEVMAYMNALQYAGFTVCPLWGSTASFFGAMINDYWFYALPAYSVFLVSLAACLLLMFKFQDIPKQFTSSAGQVSLPKEALGIQLIDIEAASNATVKDANSKNANKDLGSIIESVNSPMATTRSENIRERGGSTGIMIVKEDGNSPKSDDELLFRKKSDYLESTTIVILALMLVNIVARGAIAIYETTVAALAHDNYGISIFEIGLIVSVVGSVGTLQLVFFKKLYSRFTDMQLMMGSLGVMSIAQLFMWDFEQDTNGQEGTQPLGSFICAIILMYGLGYPVAQTAVLGAFTKVKATGPQGQLQSWFATTGSISRIVLPITAAYMNAFPARGSFLVTLGFLVLAIILLMVLRNQVVYFTEQRFIDDPLSKCDKLLIAFLSLISFTSIFIVVSLDQILKD